MSNERYNEFKVSFTLKTPYKISQKIMETEIVIMLSAFLAKAEWLLLTVEGKKDLKNEDHCTTCICYKCVRYCFNCYKCVNGSNRKIDCEEKLIVK